MAAEEGAAPDGPSVEELKAVLKRYWGHNNFRPRQLEIIQSVIWGKDVVALMATGMGKVRALRACMRVEGR
jgi:ATP-dependent DNA helicase RecQ